MIGAYRIRIVRYKNKPDKFLDIRQYVETQTFKGFTKRGMRLNANRTAEFIDFFTGKSRELLKHLQMEGFGHGDKA